VRRAPSWQSSATAAHQPCTKAAGVHKVD